ncbi:MAG: hypothetical protein ABI584_00345 [Acidobacteriota bacterium]
MRPTPARVSARLVRRAASGSAAPAPAPPARPGALTLRLLTRAATGRDAIALLARLLRLAARVFLLFLALAVARIEPFGENAKS